MRFTDEQNLIEQLKEGQNAAVETWYTQSKNDLMHFFIAQTGNESDAQELVHDTFLSCLASLPLFRGESGLWTFMISIARHELADYWRKKYAKKAIALLPFGEELLESVNDRQNESPITHTEGEILPVLRKLPEEIAEILQLKYIDGFSVKDLAIKYGLSFTAMQSKLHRAKELFKKEYERTTIS